MNKKKIVFFIGQVGFGGTEKQMALFLKNVSKKNFEFHIVVFNSSLFGDMKNEILQSKAFLYFIPEKVNTIFKKLRYLYFFIKKIKPNIIHSWSVHDNSYAGILGIIFNIQTIGSVRGSLRGTGFKKLPLIYKWSSLRLVQRIIVNTQSINDELIQYGISKDRIIVIKNAVNEYQNYSKIRNYKYPVLCTIGNLRYNKNHELFIRIVKSVLEEIPNTKGWIIGQPVQDEPHQKEKLNELIRSLKMNENIELLGFQPEPLELLKKSDVFILPSYSEGYPNTILEALSVGVLVIASKVGGVPEIIKSGINGFMYNPDDLKGFSKMVVKILRNKKKYNEVIKFGLKTVHDFHSPQKMVDRYAKVYDVK